MIDVLRATTTLAYAFRAGAREARFYRTPASARRVAARAPVEVLLCGERLGRRIAGFDLGNSPAEYAPSRVSGATLLFTSTNGSRAFLDTRASDRQWAAAFVNASAAVAAVAEWLGAPGDEEPAPRIVLVCAGKEGEPALEDSLCAAHLAERLSPALERLGWTIETAGDRLPPPPSDPQETVRRLRESPHGRYLRSLGQEFVTDVERCAEWDALDTVPTGSRGRLSRSGVPGR